MTSFPAKAIKPGKHFHEGEGLGRLLVVAKYFTENARLFSWMEFSMLGKPAMSTQECERNKSVLKTIEGKEDTLQRAVTSMVPESLNPCSSNARFKNQNLSF